jgi:N-acylneuraminate cytidylyltransferase
VKTLCIIPARGGSKRIPRKNIKPFMGKPIIAYSIEAALNSNVFDKVMVSTDDEEIARVARHYGAEVPFMRSAETAGDYASTADVLTEVLERYKAEGISFDAFCCLYSTAPFVTPERLHDAFALLTDGVDALFSMVEYSYPIQRSLKVNGDGFVEMNYPEHRSSRSQDLEKTYHDAGQFYFVKTQAFLSEKTLWCRRTVPFVLSELEVQDLDTETDWKLAEMKFALRQEQDGKPQTADNKR